VERRCEILSPFDREGRGRKRTGEKKGEKRSPMVLNRGEPNSSLGLGGRRARAGRRGRLRIPAEKVADHHLLLEQYLVLLEKEDERHETLGKKRGRKGEKKDALYRQGEGAEASN